MQIETAEIAKLSLERGDILWVQLSDKIDPKLADEAIRHAMKAAGVSVPVLYGNKGDVEITVIKASAAA